MTGSGSPVRSSSSLRPGLLVFALCAVTIVVDGYDLIVYGTTLPAILEYAPWGVSEVQAGAIGSYALIGMLIGALVVGTVTDVVGRRRIMLVCTTWFSLAMVGCAMAPSAEVFGALRFVAGLGLGGVVPTAIALTIEFAPPGRRMLANSVMFSGYSVGGIIAALVTAALLADVGFRAFFLAGGLVPLVTVVPLAWKLLPESPGFLLARGRTEEARATAARFGLDLEQYAADAAATPEDTGDKAGTRGLRVLFSAGYVRATVLFWGATFLGLLLVYGFNTWLPQIMREAGYPLGSAILFLLALNLGAIIGTPLAGAAADRIGSKPVTAAAFLVAAACIALLAVRLPTAALYALVAVAGLGTIGTTILVNAYTAKVYPSAARATGLGWALGVGRLGAILGPMIGGLILGSSLGFVWNFLVFAVLAMVGGLLVLLVPQTPTTAAPATVPSTVSLTAPASGGTTGG
ncbi:MAG: MFS transporter [Actinomycetes bacterium]